MINQQPLKRLLVKLNHDTNNIESLSFTREEFFQNKIRYAQGMSISGMQQKISLKYVNGNYEPCNAEGEYILKPSQEGLRFSAENEYCAMLISQYYKIKTAECSLVKFKDSTENAYITKRFDRDIHNIRIAQEDMNSIFNLSARDINNKISKNYETVINKIIEVTGRKPPAIELLKRIMFSYLISNSDLHLKNISVIYNEKIGYSLSPSYDLLMINSLLEYNENKEQTSMACGLLCDEENTDVIEDEYFTEHFEHYGFYTGHDFLELAKRLNINKKVVSTIVQDFYIKLSGAIEIIEQSLMPEQMKQQAINDIKTRMKVLQIGVIED
ncbi:MAG: HipA domain-containing protein [Pseudomonadales bacterium]|nr:HipA domain-containing protein [Pseudomonadales bacterium]